MLMTTPLTLGRSSPSMGSAQELLKWAAFGNVLWKTIVRREHYEHYENIRVSRHCSPLSRCFKLVGQNHISSILTKLFCRLCKTHQIFQMLYFQFPIKFPSRTSLYLLCLCSWTLVCLCGTGEMDDIAIRPHLKKNNPPSQTFSPGVDHPCIPLNEWMFSLHINHISWDDISEMFGGRWRII